jgi:TatA/E family protein of Tat protein translocase
VYAFILDSLGSTELLLILVVALIFFGPRKLPELARSMGKGLSEFRKASDDFKRTWEREVEMEATRTETNENTILNENSETKQLAEPVDQPLYTPVDSEQVVARESSFQPDSSVTSEAAHETSQSEPQQKHDWL